MARALDNLLGPVPTETSNAPPAQQGLSQLSAGFERTLSTLAPLLSMVPGLKNYINSPAGQALQLRSEGRRLTEILARHRPDLQTINPRGSMTLNRPGGGTVGTGLQEQGDQALLEREQTFRQLQGLGSDQQAATEDFRTNINEALKTGGKLDQELAKLGPQTAASFEQALNGLSVLKKQTNAMIQTGLNTAGQLFKQVITDQKSIRAGFLNEVAGRASAMATGLDAQAQAGFTEHVRAIESAGGSLSAEERSALRMVYSRDAARNKGDILGRLFETTTEVRANLETSLNQTLQRAAEATVSSVSSLVATKTSADVAVAQVDEALRTSKATALQSINATRTNLLNITSALTLDGGSRLFDMVTNTVRPVLAFSDILSGIFDGAWDIVAYNNNTQIQRLSNEMSIQNPMHAAAFEGVGILSRNDQMDAQKDAASEAARGEIIGGGISAFGSIVGGGLAGR